MAETGKIFCQKCRNNQTLAGFPKPKPQEISIEEDSNETELMYPAHQVEAREKAIKRALRKIWIADSTTKKDAIVEEILDRMEVE